MSTKPLQVSGMAGFEYLALGKDAHGGQLIRCLVVVLYPSGHPVMMIGTASPERFDEAMPDFRAMIKSFRSKL